MLGRNTTIIQDIYQTFCIIFFRLFDSCHFGIVHFLFEKCICDKKRFFFFTIYLTQEVNL